MQDSNIDPLDGSDPEGDLDGPLPLRQAYRRLERKAAEDTQEAEKRGFEQGRAEARRELLAEQLATSMGFTPQFGATFLRANQDAEPTSEAMRAYAEQLGVPVNTQAQPPQEPTNSVPEEVQQGAQEFAPTSDGAPHPGKLYTAQEWLELFQNPATRGEADRAAKEGRVQIKNNVTGAGGFGRHVGITGG